MDEPVSREEFESLKREAAEAKSAVSKYVTHEDLFKALNKSNKLQKIMNWAIILTGIVAAIAASCSAIADYCSFKPEAWCCQRIKSTPKNQR